MRTIKWDNKFFEESGLYVWIYNSGHLESTNERFYKSNEIRRFVHKNNRVYKRRRKMSSLGIDWLIK